MDKSKKLIWAYLSMKKGTYDNDYYFYEDGTILHHFDRTIGKLDIEEYISASSLSETEKEKIVLECESECTPEIVNQVRRILELNK